MKIPQMFYLRKQTLKCFTAKGIITTRTVHMYWNYRGTVQGICDTPIRNSAKREILNTNPEAEFWR